MDFALYQKCVDEVARENKSTSFWIPDNGEALLLGNTLYDMIKYAKNKGLKDVNLNTNGMLFNEEAMENIFETGVDRIVFGVDGISSKSYNKIRVGGNYDLVVKNINTILKKKRSLNLIKPEITVQFIIMDENEHEEEAFKDYWLGQGAIVKIRRKLTWGGYIISDKLNTPKEKRIPCVWICNLFHVFWDGTVPRCSGDHEAKHIMGNIKHESIASIWNNKLKYYRQFHLLRKFDQLPEQCHVCKDWQVGGSEKNSPSVKALI